MLTYVSELCYLYFSMKISTVQQTQIDHIKTGASVRQLRKRKKVSLRNLAIQMGVSAPFLSDLELGRRSWTEERFNQAQRLLK